MIKAPSAATPLRAASAFDHLLVLNRTGQTKIESGHEKQHRQRRQVRWPAVECRPASAGTAIVSLS